ncbi:hypothetical protein QSH57_004276 [Fusarium oxysporum f. sp. vasinfectum]|nr:hypothetical protein QSH57_004276 [Fusarium oxysporum f. sp. vasinfectum]
MSTTTDNKIRSSRQKCSPEAVIVQLPSRDPSPFNSSSTALSFIEANSTSFLLARNTTAAARPLIECILTIEKEKVNHAPNYWFGERCRMFNLPQEDEVLRNILNDSQLKKKAEDFIYKYGEPYIVTRFVTVIDVSCHLGGSNSAGVNIEAHLSTALEVAIAAAGSVPVELLKISAERQKRVSVPASRRVDISEATRWPNHHDEILGYSRAEDTMFGHEDGDNTEEVETWQGAIRMAYKGRAGRHCFVFKLKA